MRDWTGWQWLTLLLVSVGIIFVFRCAYVGYIHPDWSITQACVYVLTQSIEFVREAWGMTGEWHG